LAETADDVGAPAAVKGDGWILSGLPFAGNLEHPYKGVGTVVQHLTALLTADDALPEVLLLYSAYDIGDKIAMQLVLWRLYELGFIGGYDLLEVPPGVPFDLDATTLEAADVVVLDASPNKTSPDFFLLSDTTLDLLQTFKSQGGTLVGSAHTMVDWFAYSAWGYAPANPGVSALFGGVTPDPTHFAAVAEATDGKGGAIHTLNAAYPWLSKDNSPAFHYFWRLTLPDAESCAASTIADTFVVGQRPDQNRGAANFLDVRSRGKRRALLRFDVEAIEKAAADAAKTGATVITGASLQLTIQMIGKDWGAQGRPVAAHALAQSWVEGNGISALSVGSGAGATWNCGVDADISDKDQDCDGGWNLIAAGPATDTTVLSNGQSGAVSWDVTTDVAAVLAGESKQASWMVKTLDESEDGTVRFAAREGPQETAPRLVLTFGAPPACVPADCDDGNPCTDDGCAGDVCAYVDNHNQCDDGDVCTIGDVCSEAACAGDPNPCDDGSACTQDLCIAGAGCEHVADVTPCIDDDPCTVDGCGPDGTCMWTPADCDDGDACTVNVCQPGRGCDSAPISCDDEDKCTIDSCEPGVGCAHEVVTCPALGGCVDHVCLADQGCTAVFNTAVCEDGDRCTDYDVCKQGVCTGTPVDCDDGNACTADVCAAHGCQHTAVVCGADDSACTVESCDPAKGCVVDVLACDDENACTVDNCDAGTGCAHVPLLCDDNNPCTDDACDAVSGCVAVSNTASCDDQDPCTYSDVCAEGECAGAPVVCDDSNPCTDDTCDGVCVFTPNTAACDDGDACTAGDVCAASACTGGGPVLCDDGDECTEDGCDAVSGCSHLAVGCDDGNPCTDDTCTAAGGCAYAPNAVACDDGDPCTYGDACADTLCAGLAVACDDGNPCTDDACVAGDGCVSVGNASPCDDLDACTAADQCAAGKCVGAVVDCDDGSVCTLDACDKGAGCSYEEVACDDGDVCTDDGCDPTTGCVAVSNQAPCDDAQACTSGDQCVAGVCAGEPLDCDDGDPCTDDACAGDAGCVSTVNGATCDDGDLCTEGDKCTSDGCTGHALSCDDADPCTDDSCDPAAGCVYSFSTAACDDDDPCTASDVCSSGACAGGPVDCDDDLACTADACSAVSGCQHVPDAAVCDDGELCTDDVCDLALGCLQTSNAEPCDDGDACTGSDACADGACAGGGPTDCNDSNACTQDLCDAFSGCSNVPIVCDDSDECTTDTCDPVQGCVFVGTCDGPTVFGGDDAAIAEGFEFTRSVGFADQADSGPWKATVDFGDGLGPLPAAVSSSKSVHVSHLYADDGTYDVVVTVTNAAGDAGTAAFEISVENAAPIVYGGGKGQPVEGSPYYGILTVLDVSGDTFVAVVDYGDGTEPETLDIAGKYGAFGPHVYADDGSYTLSVTVTDDDGGVGTLSVPTVVKNVSPTFAQPDNQLAEDDPVVLAGVFADPGDDSWSGTVDWGDGSGPMPVSVDADAMAFSAQHVFVDHGVYSVSVTLSDEDEGSTTRTFYVIKMNPNPTMDFGLPPIGAEGYPVAHAVTVTAPVSDHFTATGEFSDGTGKAFVAVEPAQKLIDVKHTWNDDGLFPVILQLHDSGTTLTEAFYVIIENVDPVPNLGGPGKLMEGQTFYRTRTVLDPGKDQWIGTVDYGDGTIESFAVSSWGGYDLAHTYNDSGDYTVTVTIEDDDGGSGTESMTLAVSNAPPKLSCGTHEMVKQGGLLTRTCTFTDSGTADTWQAVVNFGDGSDSVTPVVDQVGHAFDISHKFFETGKHKVVITLTDDDGGAHTRGFWANVIPNTAPAFDVVSDVPVDGLPVAVAAGQLGGDSLTDLAIANDPGDSVTVLVQTAPGVFGSASMVLVGLQPAAVAVADMDGDGADDLVTANSGSGDVSVVYQDPTAPGAFAFPSAVPSGAGPAAIAVADLNDDGAPDIATANADGGNLAVLLQSDQPGIFLTPAGYATGAKPSALAIADFNGDAAPDIAVANAGGDSLTVRYHAGDGADWPTADTLAADTSPVALVAVDMDGDGRLDLVAANEGADTISLHLADPSGGWLPASVLDTASGPRALGVGDLDANGAADLAVVAGGAGTTTVLRQIGPDALAFEAIALPPTYGGEWAVLIEDLDGDGKGDVVVLNHVSASLSVHLGQ